MIQVLLDALSTGGLYGLAALGIGLVFGVMRLVNFAHGELIALGAFLLITTRHWGLVPSLVITLVAVAALAVLLEFGVFRRLRGAEPAVLLVASFGVSVLLQKVYEAIFGTLPISGQVASWMSGQWTVAGVNVTRGSVATVALTIVLLAAMKYAVERTSLGLQLQAASSELLTARLLGVRANRIITVAFAAGGLLAAVVAFVLVAQRGQAEPLFGVNITILALVGTVIGGLGNLQGAALGGMLVGSSLSILNAVLGNLRVYSASVLFVMVILVLLFRPDGLLRSRASGERV